MIHRAVREPPLLWLGQDVHAGQGIGEAETEGFGHYCKIARRTLGIL